MDHTFLQHNWKWYQLKYDDADLVHEITKEYQPCDDWMKGIKEKKSNLLQIDVTKLNKEFLRGSIVYQQNIDDKEDHHLFYFYITREFFITVGLDFEILESTNLPAMLDQMERATSPIEGFSILLADILNNFLRKVDEFEVRLRKLMWRIQEENNISILDDIFDTRHELLIRKNLMIPLMEVEMGLEETFNDEINKKPEYQRLSKRLERGLRLIGEYQQEIDTMIDLEEVVSTHRGNEIIKTLTVFTVLFTPLMALGALWGMNFEFMPELKWKFGYLYAIILMVISTVAIYLYLRLKGWMGDILTPKEKDSFFK
ncbi:magnesium transporter CorA family protein [Bacillus sp. V33-4]|uniref:magnesium transporter CorA family protein n=1 Tax=Bacillus sp. V33-4 TaxID=2054169 RepID=UPI000C768014|nr:magnesium transporter CorA family protein [Bacillus sp. V33-4]PLR87074.1 hypothetical protein CVD23_04440 [Bacillus sp. V33-4]